MRSTEKYGGNIKAQKKEKVERQEKKIVWLSIIRTLIILVFRTIVRNAELKQFKIDNLEVNVFYLAPCSPFMSQGAKTQVLSWEMAELVS